jgi:hemerythrin-like metal-binding protein
MTQSAAISWDNTPRMNVPSLDDDHQIIILTINKIIKLLHSKGKEAELSSATRKLMLYTSSHLSKEELFLEKHGYPLLPQHKKEHVHLLNTLLQI